MRPKRHFSFGSIKYSDRSFYIHHEKVDIASNCEILNEVIESENVKLCDIPKLQNEIENISSIIAYRMMNLKALLDEDPMQVNNEIIHQNSKPSNYLPCIPLPITKNDILRPEDIEHNDSPKRQKGSRNLNGKRKLTNDISATKSKRQKSSNKSFKPNYEIPNKFWELMEPYCCEITNAHISTLETYIQNYENDAKYYETPEIDNNRVCEQQFVSNQETTEKHTLNGLLENKSDFELSSLLRKIDNEIRQPLSQIRTLKVFPQHLVNSMSQTTNDLIQLHSSNIRDIENGISPAAGCQSASLAKLLKVNNGYKIEKYIKQSVNDLGMCNFNLPFVPKLEPKFDLRKTTDEQGIAKSSEAEIIDPIILGTDSGTNGIRKVDCERASEDKTLVGLRRRQMELRLVSESNVRVLKGLLVIAKRDVRRQEIERRLAVADADVIESYRIIEGYRPSHKLPLKKDRDLAYKAMRERTKILKELEVFDGEFM